MSMCFATFNLGNMWQTNNDLAQSFVNNNGGATYKIDTIQILFGPNYFLPKGTVTVEIRSNNGAVPMGGAPLATVTYTPTPSTWNTITGLTPASIQLNRGVTYWLVLHDNAIGGEAPETRYSIRAGRYTGASGLLFGLSK